MNLFFSMRKRGLFVLLLLLTFLIIAFDVDGGCADFDNDNSVGFTDFFLKRASGLSRMI